MFSDLNSEILNELQLMLSQINLFVNIYMTAGNMYKETNATNIKLYIHNTHDKDIRQYNQPTASEVAVIILDDEEIPKEKDIVIYRKEENLKHMSELHGIYDSLQYPLLFSYREYGWHEPILRANESDPEDIDLDEGESSRHTDATQDMENLFLELSSKSSKSKGKGKAIETEVETEEDNDDNDDKSESDKDNDTEEGQPIIKKRK